MLMLLLPLSRHFLLGSAMYVERLLGLENLGVLTWSNLGVLTASSVTAENRNTGHTSPCSSLSSPGLGPEL